MLPPSLPRWLALIACLMAAAVPAAGLVVCVHDGELEVGIGDDCACELPQDHPDCDHVEVDGGGERVAGAPRVGPPAEVQVTPGDGHGAEVHGEAPPTRGGREPPSRWTAPPGRVGAPPWIARHLIDRSTTTLLV